MPRSYHKCNLVPCCKMYFISFFFSAMTKHPLIYDLGVIKCILPRHIYICFYQFKRAIPVCFSSCFGRLTSSLACPVNVLPPLSGQVTSHKKMPPSIMSSIRKRYSGTVAPDKQYIFCMRYYNSWEQAGSTPELGVNSPGITSGKTCPRNQEGKSQGRGQRSIPWRGQGQSSILMGQISIQACSRSRVIDPRNFSNPFCIIQINSFYLIYEHQRLANGGPTLILTRTN